MLALKEQSVMVSMPRLYSFVIPMISMILNGHYLSNIYLVLC